VAGVTKEQGSSRHINNRADSSSSTSSSSSSSTVDVPVVISGLTRTYLEDLMDQVGV
jgi:hypothetical protein